MHEKTKLPTVMDSTDIELLSGHFRSTLRFNGKPVESKTWWKEFPYAENYDDFLKRLENNNKQVFNACFQTSSIDKEIVEAMLRNADKTTYQLSYSSDVFNPRTEKRRFAKLKNQVDNFQYEETTYRTYFKPLQNIKTFKKLQNIGSTENKMTLSNNLKQFTRCNRSTYHDEIAMLGKLFAKPTLPGPIDRYSLRKV